MDRWGIGLHHFVDNGLQRRDIALYRQALRFHHRRRTGAVLKHLGENLFLGDVVGAPGREVLSRRLPEYRTKHGIDFTVVNAENVVDGSGEAPYNGDIGIADGVITGVGEVSNGRATTALQRPLIAPVTSEFSPQVLPSIDKRH